MDKEQAKRIIKDTFEASFNPEKFIYFIMNLLNLKQSDIKNTFFGIRQGYNIPEMFRPYISRFQRIAKYLKDDQRIDVLIVYLKKETSIECARSRQRNFIAGYLKGNYGSDKSKDAAIVAFISPNKADWRFSLVKIDYRFNEKGKIDERLSSAKRWSFLVGKNESSHTAQSRLVSILSDDQYNPTLAQLEEAFNIEKVTKEFFLKYRNLFLRIKEELDKVVENDPKVKKDFSEKGIDTVNFAKKFLGQIVFLYFLQKKGWFGVSEDKKWGEGDKNFIRNLFLECSQKRDKNFFNDYLEYLFYDALNNNNRKSADPAYYNKFNCKIPFLNGGLFEPIGNYDWVHIDINLSNKLFSNRNGNYEGNGVLDIFDLFNFTVKEDEPLEKEVAIDPELLGKIYEKFNAIRPDNYEEYKKALKSGRKGEENKFNKKFGVYYTPLEIVHYMCQQSLVNYLHTFVNQELMKRPVTAARQIKLIGLEEPEQLGFPIDKEIVDKKAIEELIKYGEQFTENEQVVEKKEKETETYKYQLLPGIRKNAKVIDEKLKDIRICDPAVGSGAFPVGMMAEIVKTRNVLSAYIKDQNRTPYNFKRECIEKSLYGVDIDPGAVEIAKLRLWLSLIVDEEDITKINPLPNLDYKIMQGNSLIEILTTEFLAGTIDKKKNDLVKQLKKAKDELFGISNPLLKDKKRKEVELLIARIIAHDKKVAIRKLKSKIDGINSQQKLFKNKKIKDADRKKIFELEQKIQKIEKLKLPSPPEHFEWHINFIEVFDEKDGFDVVIANPPYVRQEKIRDLKLLLQKQGYEVYNSTSDLYTYFYERSYHILKPEGFSCFISSNKWMRAKYGKKLRKFFNGKTTLKQIIDFNGYQVFEATVDTDILLFQKTKPSGNTVNILNIQQDFTPSTDIYNYFNSHKLEMKQSGFDSNCFTFADKTTMNLKKKIEEQGIPLKNWNIKIKFGIKTGFNKSFIITTEKRDEILANCKTEEERKRTVRIVKPILRGRDIYRYGYKWAELWLIKIKSRYTNQNRGKRAPEIFFKKIYPAVHKHLKTFGNTKGKGKGLYNRDDQGNYWWELRDCNYYPEFEKDKIVYSDIADRLLFAYDRQKIYTNNTVYFLNTGNKYLLAALNSKTIDFYYRQITSQLGNAALRAFTIYIEQLPIPKISESDQKPFIELVDRILAITKDSDYLENSIKQARVHECERQINKMVYKLYNLTQGEIEIVEGFKNK